MSEYSELIKNFARIRDYMREFFVFGFKSRNDFSQKSKRTYDNEKRRIENYLGDLAKWEYGENGKNVFISVDSSKISQNPFFKAFKSKSFTDNDIILHFLILDVLTSEGNLSLEEIAEKINDRVDDYIEPQTIRNKLKEYAELGIIDITKEKKAYFYSLSLCSIEDLKLSNDTINFFTEVAPFGVIGSYLSDRINNSNSKFSYKHHFIINTLEDNILLELITAIKEKKRVSIENFSNRNQIAKNFNIIPLMIYVSVQTGRRYLIAESDGKSKFSTYRLDYIKSVKLLNKAEKFDELKKKLDENIKFSFSTTIMKEPELEHLEIVLFINEKTEDYILKRLEREGHLGKIFRLKRNVYKFETDVFNSNELTTWIKTFIGRIIEINGTNKTVIRRFYNDINKMSKMYNDIKFEFDEVNAYEK